MLDSPTDVVFPLAAPLAAGLLLGVGAAVPPGPVNLEIARRAARGGMLAGTAVGFGAVTVDLVLAALLSLGVLALIDRTPWLRVPISLVGIVLLAYLGTGALRSFWRSRQVTSDEPRHGVPPVEASDAAAPQAGPAARRAAAPLNAPLRGYATGLLLCGTSPYQAAFWLTAVPTILARSGDGGRTDDLAARLALCVGVFAATLTWVLCFSGLMAFAGSLDRRRWLPRAMDLVGGATLLGFAAASALRLAAGVLSSPASAGQ